MFSLFKKKKKSSSFSPAPVDTAPPASRVRTMRSQGLSDSVIIKNLRGEGYSPLEVDKAMKDSLRYGVVNQQAPPQQESYNDTSLPLPGSTIPQTPREGRRFVFPDQEPEMPPLMPGPRIPEPPGHEEFEDDLDDDMPPLRAVRKPSSWEKKLRSKRELEEIVEGAIDEKSIDMERRTIDTTNKIQHLENKINVLEKHISELQGEKKTEIEEIKDMINSYSESISELTGKMESLERALKDALTPMMHSLRSLTETIKIMKTKK